MSSTPCTGNYMETITGQTRTAYGCLVIGQSLWAKLKLYTDYRLYARTVCDTTAPLPLVVLLPFNISMYVTLAQTETRE